MTDLLATPPYDERDDPALLAELQQLTQWHLDGCEPFARMWPGWQPTGGFAELPYVHVSVFKHLDLRTEGDGIEHQRTLLSSSTTGKGSSRVVLDRHSSELQARSSVAILRDFVGADPRPLLVLDDPRSLRGRGEVSARVAAALSLQPLATDLRFVAKQIGSTTAELDPERILAAIDGQDDVIAYGFTWILWAGLVEGSLPAEVRDALRRTRVSFVHSGGWKRLEALDVGADEFEERLLALVAPRSTITDFYGLVEQVGVVFPRCEAGRRHVPRWGALLVRDPFTLEPTTATGVIQSMNPLARGGPYHSVLTEDLGRLHATACPCGRAGTTFDLIGRVPRAEVRGCANV